MPTKTRINGENYSQLPRLVSDDIILKGLPNTPGAPDGYGDLASAVGSFFTVLGDPTGTDDTAAIEAAIQQAKMAGGGTVRIPAGVWYAENLSVENGITITGDGWYSTRLILKTDATLPLFKYKSSSILQMFNMEKLSIEGIGKSGPDGVDVSQATAWIKSGFTDMVVKGFRRGVSGSQDDRKPIFTRVNYSECESGHYVKYNHPFWVSCDFRLNTVGIDGELLYDSQMTNCVFAYNDYGVDIRSGDLNQTNIANTIFFTNKFADLTVNARVNISNCLFASGTGRDATACGIDIVGEGDILINSCLFKNETDTYGDCCIRVKSAASPDRKNIQINNCEAINQPRFFRAECPSLADFSVSGGTIRDVTTVFEFSNSTRILNASIGIDTASGVSDFLIVNQTVVQGFMVKNNNVRLSGRLAHFKSANLNDLQSVQVTGNSVNQAGDSPLTATQGVIEFSSGTSGAGFNVSQNTYRKDAAGVMNGFFIRMADASNSIVKDNIIRRSSGISLVTTNANTKNVDNIYIP